MVLRVPQPALPRHGRHGDGPQGPDPDEGDRPARGVGGGGPGGALAGGDAEPRRRLGGVRPRREPRGAHSHAVRRGVDYLVRMQRPDGTWDEEPFTGTGFPKVFYLKYHLYRLYFPLMALARYAREVAPSPPSPPLPRGERGEPPCLPLSPWW